MSDALDVFLTVDVGPDGATLGHGHGETGSWGRGEAGLPILTDAFRRFEDRLGARLGVSWFFRADRFIAAQLGDALAVFRKSSTLIDRLLERGDEVGWMPQVYSTAQSAVDLEDLITTYRAIESELAPPHSVRMGDCFHSNETMKTLDELGVRLDSSAIPGREKSDRGWRMSWIGTPRTAYRPSVADYRRPGAPHLAIVELPLSVLPIRAPYDAEPLARYLNPCMRREFLRPALSGLVQSSPYLVCVLHPDEVVGAAAEDRHPLVAYSVDELAFNLGQLIEVSRESGRALSFRTVGEFSLEAAARDGS